MHIQHIAIFQKNHVVKFRIFTYDRIQEINSKRYKMNNYAKVIIEGSPISKSNFKLSNVNGRAILPYNSGKYYDRYAHYEEQIAYECRLQNPNLVLTQSLIAVLKVYYKSKKKHPDTTNITKSIFDGIEKSGLIINDAQITRLVIEEYYDNIHPRFELELFEESSYNLSINIEHKSTPDKPIEYDYPSNKKSSQSLSAKKFIKNTDATKLQCGICGKILEKDMALSANKGTLIICKDCFKKLY